MANPNHPSNSAHAASNTASDWSWLRSRLDSSAVTQATDELDDWIGQQLQVLEEEYADMITVDSRKRVAGGLVKVRR